jgi:hypothetical protein
VGCAGEPVVAVSFFALYFLSIPDFMFGPVVLRAF